MSADRFVCLSIVVAPSFDLVLLKECSPLVAAEGTRLSAHRGDTKREIAFSMSVGESRTTH